MDPSTSKQLFRQLISDTQDEQSMDSVDSFLVLQTTFASPNEVDEELLKNIKVDSKSEEVLIMHAQVQMKF